MDRATIGMFTRTAGTLSLTVLLLYGGMAMERAQSGVTETTVLVIATALGALAAVWGLTHLNALRAAAWTTLVLLGVLPVLTFLGWFLTADAGGALNAVLWLNLLTGLATALLAGWTLATEEPASTPRERAARAG